MAAADYYSDDAAPSGTASTATETAAPAEQTSTTKTALIDSAICPGMAVGDEMVVKIEKVLDQEYLVSYAPEPGEEEEGGGETEPMRGEGYGGPPGGGGGMAAMME